MFTDIAGFTTLVEGLEPTTIGPLLNEYLTGLTEIVFEHGGTLVKIIGDGLNILFGAPTDQPDHAARAVACALALDAYAERFRARWRERGVAVGTTRIGIHAGPALVGNFGGGRFFDYTAYGDTINIAARLEAANKQLGTRICVSAGVVERMAGFRGRPVGNVLLRGRSEPLTAHEPLTRGAACPCADRRVSGGVCQDRGRRTGRAARVRRPAGTRQQRRAGRLSSEATARRRHRQPGRARMTTQRSAHDAALRRQLDEYRAERDAALAREAALAEVLQAINASPGDLAPVFDAMLEKALHLCEAAFGVLCTYDGELYHTVAMRGVSPGYADLLREHTPPCPRHGHRKARARRGPRAHRRHYRRRHIPVGEPAPPGPCRSGRRAHRGMGSPPPGRHLARHDRQSTARRCGRSPTSRSPCCENFAAQAVIAMENARLITEQRAALEQQTATAEVLQVINASPGDLAPVFDAILEKAHKLCEIAYGSLELYDGDQFRAVAVRGFSDAFAGQLRQGYRASKSPATRPLLAGDRWGSAFTRRGQPY